MQRWLISFSAVLVVMVVGLGVYTWQLSREIAEIKSEEKPSFVSALEEQALPSAAFSNSRVTPDPFQQMEQFRLQMDSMMNNFFGGSRLGSAVGGSLFGTDPFSAMGLNQPNLSLRETNSALEVVIPVQEGQQFELSTDVEQDRLTVAGTMTWSAQDSGSGVISRRSGSSQFSRTIVLPDNVDPTGLTTEHRGNEIVITLPKA